MDIQAISRAHRMGQQKAVKVIRLVSKHTVEEKIIDIATKKLLLEEIVLNQAYRMSKNDLDSVLRCGAFELFKNSLEEKLEEEFSDEQIEDFLSRGGGASSLSGNEQTQLSTTTGTNNNTNNKHGLSTKKNVNDYYLSGFKFQSLTF